MVKVMDLGKSKTLGGEIEQELGEEQLKTIP